MYRNSFAAIPFVSSLTALGISPAPGTCLHVGDERDGLSAMVAVWALVKPRAFALCLGFAITGPLIAGYAYAATLAVRSPWKPNSSTKVTSSASNEIGCSDARCPPARPRHPDTSDVGQGGQIT
jgi:hypothetical protein